MGEVDLGALGERRVRRLSSQGSTGSGVSNMSISSTRSGKSRARLRRDVRSILLLLLLYTLQGIPMGLSGSIPILLHGKISYSQQALFSLVSLPFSLKLLWAPLVDSVYYAPFGRRKSWLVPVQMACGLLMLFGSSHVAYWMGESNKTGEEGHTPNVPALTAYFLVLYITMATQDIAVDGWALTMLSRDNVGYASTCNSLGQTLGFFLAHIGFLALNDAHVCNKYLRPAGAESEVGMVSVTSFLAFWGAIFVATTLFVWFFKKERHDESENEVHGLKETYKQLVRCIRLPSVRGLCCVLLTCKVAFAVTDAATTLKLVEYGMPREEIAIMSPALVALGVIIPLAVGKMTAGPRPLDVFLAGYPMRLVVTLVYAAVLPLAKRKYSMHPTLDNIQNMQGLDSSNTGSGMDFHVYTDEGGGAMDTAIGGHSTFDYGFYGGLFCAVVLHEVATNFMYVSVMSFFARVSDPAIGGTYMTLLNTVANIGTKWPNSLSLYLMDFLSRKVCLPGEEHSTGGTPFQHQTSDTNSTHILMEGACSNSDGSAALCIEQGGHCHALRDGYNVQVVACTMLGVMWLTWGWREVLRLQNLKQKDWHIYPGRDSAKIR